MKDLREELINFQIEVYGTSEEVAIKIVDSYLAIKNFTL